MARTTVYTVDHRQAGYPVLYVDRDTLKIETFTGPFADPGNASQEFQIATPGQVAYVSLVSFKAHVQRIEQEQARLQSWQAWQRPVCEMSREEAAALNAPYCHPAIDA